MGRLAQKFYRDYEDITEYEVLLARLKENKQQLVALIERFSNDELTVNLGIINGPEVV